MVMSVRLATRKIAATEKILKLENVFHAMKRDTKNLMALNTLKMEIASIRNEMVNCLCEICSRNRWGKRNEKYHQIIE